MRYRSRPKIFIQILELLAKGSYKKTHIRSQAFLTFRQLRYYLPEMIKNKWIKYEEDTRLYGITERGLNFLNGNKMLERICGGHSFTKGKMEKVRFK